MSKEALAIVNESKLKVAKVFIDLTPQEKMHTPASHYLLDTMVEFVTKPASKLSLKIVDEIIDRNIVSQGN